MITFCILLSILLIVAAILAIAALVCGAGFVAVFGDLFICALIIGLLIKLFGPKKRAQ